MIITLIIIYLVSVIGAYKYTQFSHFNPKGEWYGLKPDFDDFLFMFIPIFNTVLSLFYFRNISDIKFNKIDWNKFFNRW